MRELGQFNDVDLLPLSKGSMRAGRRDDCRTLETTLTGRAPPRGQVGRSPRRRLSARVRYAMKAILNRRGFG